MIVDHRTYTVVHGRMAEYLERYERVALPIQNRYLEIVTGRGAFGGAVPPEFADYRLSADETRRLAEPIVAERLGTKATATLFAMLEQVDKLGSVTELLAATRAPST